MSFLYIRQGLMRRPGMFTLIAIAIVSLAAAVLGLVIAALIRVHDILRLME